MSSPFQPGNNPKFIVIHCSATKPSQDWVDADTIDQWHRAKGWLGIGYHYVITRQGEVQTGRPENTIGAHCRGLNTKSIGICLVGGVHETEMAGQWPAPEDNFTDAQWDALEELVITLLEQYPGSRVLGHRDAIKEGLSSDPPKACPCFEVGDWITQALEGLAEEAEDDDDEIIANPGDQFILHREDLTDILESLNFLSDEIDALTKVVQDTLNS